MIKDSDKLGRFKRNVLRTRSRRKNKEQLMIFYWFAAIVSQLAIALVWYLIIVAGENSVDVRGFGLYLVLTCGIPLIIHCLTNVVICKALKDRPFIIVFLASIFIYIIEFAIYLEILRNPNGKYFDQGVVLFFSLSLIPMICNILLFWLIGIRHNDFFEGCKIQRLRTRAT